MRQPAPEHPAPAPQTPANAADTAKRLKNTPHASCCRSTASTLLPFDEALQRALATVPNFRDEEVDLHEAAGRVLRQDILADREQPPFHRVMMDGFALRSAEWSAGLCQFERTGYAAAGAAPTILPEGSGRCVEVATGAPLPEGADCVIPVERVKSTAGNLIGFDPAACVRSGDSIHRAGSDLSAGAVAVPAGTRLDSRALGTAASFGAVRLRVARRPVVHLLPTGDELVEPSLTPATHQIRHSNGYALRGALARHHWPCHAHPVLADDPESAATILRPLLQSAVWLVICGAVSVGRRDFVPATLAALGCEPIFHGVAQRPGKPLGLWRTPGGGLVFGLPGNPVSALVGLHTFVLPALFKGEGAQQPPPRTVRLRDVPRRNHPLTLHLPVALDADGRHAHPAPVSNSGDFRGLLASDGFISIPPGEESVAESTFPLTLWS